MKKQMMAAALTMTLAAAAAADEWQTLSAEAADAPADAAKKPRCEMKVPAAWKITDKSAASGDEYNGSVVLEAEKPEAWWTKRKRVEFKNARMFQDTRTNFWIQVQGALVAGNDNGTTYIIGVRDGALVCHAVLEFKNDQWGDNYSKFEEKYAEIVRQMGGSLKLSQ
jgi:hypothetical protein